MKRETDSGRFRARRGVPSAPSRRREVEAQALSVRDLYALGFGLFLGLTIIKFGNPVILDRAIAPPASLREAWVYAWPPHWAGWLLAPLALIGAVIAVSLKPRWPTSRWLWGLPLIWFGWQLVSATGTVDTRLTGEALYEFAGCLACYFLGVSVLGNRRALNLLLIGVLAALAFSLVRAVKQRLFEFPQERQLLIEGQRTGWTNFPPDLLLQLKQENVIVKTNGVEAANPAILAKYAKKRVNGTFVYPNALAGAVLMLWPVSLPIAFVRTRRFRTPTRVLVIGLTLFLGGAGLVWSGSKLGWLIALLLLGVWLFRLPWSKFWKSAVLAAVLLGGLGVFAVRFHNYFAAGATSLGARFDYWRAAAQNTWEHPVIGSGPGTFQRPYGRLKDPNAEMARLTHNDYLEQFSDSGVPGGLAYVAWVALALWVMGRRLWACQQPLAFGVFLGLAGWFIQGIGEFSLYIPGLAWTAFTLLGWLLAVTGNRIDKAGTPN